ncbi:hypothetical protein EMPG_12433 [Blastomyces silverae]|uniref:Uncharacterized protein n=1 Tax=Blastomyces silverae TaxID=2060906 RepID=A0A0H1BTZ8_9EURO|nr:hypothetical protein EMPG_12433 [Blastomyces silverae]
MEPAVVVSYIGPHSHFQSHFPEFDTEQWKVFQSTKVTTDSNNDICCSHPCGRCPLAKKKVSLMRSLKQAAGWCLPGDLVRTKKPLVTSHV